MNKLNEKDVISVFRKNGYKLIKEIRGDYSHRKFLIEDSHGYKYQSTLSDVGRGKFLRIVHKGNPFSIENISLYLSLNNPDLILSGENVYKGDKGFLRIYHSKCKETYTSDWGTIKQGYGCAICRGLQVGKYNNLEHRRPDLIEDWNYRLNDVIPSSLTENSHKKVFWKCHICCYGDSGEWVSTPNSRSKTGCPACSGRVVTDKNRLSVLFPAISSEWHPIKNKELNPNDVSFGSRTKIWWLCKNNHEYTMTIQHRTTRNYGCPTCSESKGEKSVRSILNHIKLPFLEQYVFEDCRDKLPLKFDFYIPLFNLCIEYQGEQHYSPARFGSTTIALAKERFKSQKKRDKIKEKYCRENGIDLLIIPYWEFKNVATMLHSYFNERKNHGR